MAASSIQSFGKGALRVAKNYTKGYSDTQTKVREATSNDAWGPSGTQMNEIAQMTYSQQEFIEIMEMLDKRLNDKGKNWRHVFKALTLLDYCLHAGSENVVVYFKDNLYIVKTLKEFVFVDEDGKDVGANVRQKAKDITNLLMDEERLRNERRARGAMRDRMLGNIADSGLRGEPPERSSSYDTPPRPKPGKARDEDDDLKRAMEESRNMADDEQKRRSLQTKEEDDIRRAIRLSEEEDAKRKKEAEDANAKALFDDSQQVDLFAQQPQQQMGYPLIDTGYMQPQYTSFNPFLQQQMMQQQEAQRQQEEYMRQQMMMAEQQRQQQEWMQMQQQQAMMQQQALQAQPTGYRSNNPFGPMAAQMTGMPQQQQQPVQEAPPPMPAMPSFLPAPVSAPQPAQPQRQTFTPQPQQPKKDDGQHSHLANLLANRDGGMDTFGNVGALRIPVGSPFAASNRVAVQNTGMGGNNPFGQRQQQGQQQGQGEQPFFQI